MSRHGRCAQDGRIPILRLAQIGHVVLLIASLPVAAHGQDAPCDQQVLARARQGNAGYQARDANRCEGFFGAKVSGVVLKVVGFTEAFHYDETAREPLTLQWTAPENAQIFLNAQSLRYELYYQMDARAESPNRYVWDVRMLRSQDLTADEIGTVGYYTRTMGDADRNVLVPLKAGHGADVGPSAEYQLTVVPNTQLTGMNVTLHKADERGQPVGPAILDNMRIRRRQFAEGEPVIVPIDKSDLPEGGLYVAQISATRANGRTVQTPPLLFLHAGS